MERSCCRLWYKCTTGRGKFCTTYYLNTFYRGYYIDLILYLKNLYPKQERKNIFMNSLALLS